MTEIEKLFKTIVKKGSVVFGLKQTTSSIKDGKAKLVVISNNFPNKKDIEADAKRKNILCYTSHVDNVELGLLCGCAFAVSTFAVLDDGGLNVHHLLKKG